MIGLSEKNSFLIAVVLFGVSIVYGIFLMRAGFKRDDRINYLILFAGFCFQTLAMIQRGLSFSHCPVYNLYEAILFVSWSILLGFLVVGIHPKFRFLGVYTAPVVFALGIFAQMPGMDQQTPTLFGDNPRFWVNLHATIILLAYGAFGIAGLCGMMYLSRIHSLKYDKVVAFFSHLPSAERLETVLFESIIAGVTLLTAGILVGSLALKPPNGLTYASDPKVQWSIFVWLLYIFLIIMHKIFSWGARRLAFGAIGSFAFVLLTFWGVNLMSKIHNP
ncbi:MAG: cytochrome C assembly family protein [Verrucomicrobiia bacterium]